MTRPVVVVGEIYVDHVLSGFTRWPAPGEEVLTDDYTREIGGGAAVTACALAKLGRRVELVGLIGGNDAAWIRARLAAHGVGTDALRTVEDGQTGMTVSVSTAQDRSFFTHVGVNRAVGDVVRETAALLMEAAHVHFAMPLAADVAAALPALRSSSLDMGYQPAWLADRANHATLRTIDHLLPNEKEAALLAGGGGADHYLAFAATMLRHPMLKLGAAGAAALDDGVVVTVAPPAVSAIDTTGAGDAFDAGFIDALLDGADATQRLRRGCIAGALSTRAAGALAALPDAPELRSLYDRTYRS